MGRLPSPHPRPPCPHHALRNRERFDRLLMLMQLQLNENEPSLYSEAAKRELGLLPASP